MRLFRFLGARMLVIGLTAAGCGTAGTPSVSSEPEQAVTPVVTGVEPASGPVGTNVVIAATGLAATGNVVRFGRGFVTQVAVNGNRLLFAVPAGLDLCVPGASGPCAGGFERVSPGDYEIAVLVAGRSSNVRSFRVTEP